jgi:alpha-N-arabinofuranosidase
VRPGIKVQKNWTYTGSLYAKSPAYTGPVTVSLKSTTGTVFATQTIPAISSSWKKYSIIFKPSRDAPSTDNVFVVELDGARAAGKDVYFGMFTLFPPTFKNRPNGMRIDLAEAMAGTAPKIWRFPGGNNLEGMVITDRWKWNETIGPYVIPSDICGYATN